MSMKNKVQLICYTDRFGGGNIAQLHQFLITKMQSLFEGGVHLLPFFAPIDGADAGYDPTNHKKVDERLGNWDDITSMAQDFDLLVDLIVNHVSDKSEEFQDVAKHGSASEYFDLFLTKDKVFKNGATEEGISEIYRPRPHRPFSVRKLKNGEIHEFWTTFSRYQLDIDVKSEQGKNYLHNIFEIFAKSGVKTVRLDAVGYAIKQENTSCFMLPETLDFIKELTDIAHNYGMETLGEIHSHYETQIDISNRVDYVYDFALPPLILYTLFSKSSTRLKQWWAISPRNCITVLDTHDGIGVVDVASYEDKPGILSDQEVHDLVEQIHQNSNNTSKKATGTAASNLDLYQVNCTFYEALGKNDDMYLMARAIQFFAPGIPQVYYAGLLAAENDMELLESTKVGRDINRPYYRFDEIEKALEKKVVKDLMKMIEFRNTHPSFQGHFRIADCGDGHLHLRWEKAEHWAELDMDLSAMEMNIKYSDQENHYRVL